MYLYVISSWCLQTHVGTCITLRTQLNRLHFEIDDDNVEKFLFPITSKRLRQKQVYVLTRVDSISISSYFACSFHHDENTAWFSLSASPFCVKRPREHSLSSQITYIFKGWRLNSGNRKEDEEPSRWYEVKPAGLL